MLKPTNADLDPVETSEWLDSFADVLQRSGPERASHLLHALNGAAHRAGVDVPHGGITPYVNTIPVDRQPAYPGDRALERRIKSILRWNAAMMVARSGMGGHISTYASSATLLEVGFNHFFRGPDHACGGDFIYFQGHASPGIYARAHLEGRLDDAKLTNFRRELAKGGGLSSYPHPWLMPDFWQFPTVSMGLGPLCALYHARFIRYLEDRGLKQPTEQKVWCFIGDGEIDEVETLGAIHLASRDNLDNLVFVVNCNLQRLDGPVRGNGKVIQELEGFFRGAGWNAIKVVWGTDWDPLLAKDRSGLLTRRLGEIVDGDYQKYVVEDGNYFLDHFCGSDPDLRACFDDVPVETVHRLRRGGHDPSKVYAAYRSAMETIGQPTVILAKTVKGYGLGENWEGSNKAHQIKDFGKKPADVGVKMREFRDRFEIPITDAQIEQQPFYHPGKDSPEYKYLMERREALGGSIPRRRVKAPKLAAPKSEALAKILEGAPTQVSTTFMMVQTLGLLLRNKELGPHLVPIIPDEGRTFGMEGMMSNYGVYSPHGQLYTPVDAGAIGSWTEAKTGQCLEEGINEAGAMASFVAAGSSYANHGVPMIPFYIYYSMFGFQRIGDLAWLAGDQRVRGFMLGATAGRTTLNGEGLQHQDGHSHLVASTIPNLLAYDPAFGFEVALIVQEGIRRMYEQGEDVLYYITLFNEPYEQPAMPQGVAEGVIRGAYKFRSRDAAKPKAKSRVRLLGSGSILPHVLKAQEMLAEKYGVSSDVCSVTSYSELRRDCQTVERRAFLKPEAPAEKSYLRKLLGDANLPTIAASDNVKLVPEQIAPWVPGLVALGTDGYGRSETRQNLRRHFEVDAEFTVYATLVELANRGEFDRAALPKVRAELGIDPDKPNPLTA
ncbi:MAG TPA: pyruvate dehydrogenase (acetyl-transferring), homodimeric type [Planctomycetia bacterium]|nr:pyruvate dehydrogenase (acetyl-transferring), homodimeric type [Planctomycetia bacterium]